MTSAGPRTFYLWALIACPAIGVAVAAFGVSSEGGVAEFAAIFIGLPALLAAAGGLLARRTRAEIGVTALAAGLLGLLAWGVIGLWLGVTGLYN